MAASRLLRAAAACVILLSFAAENRKSYWRGCIHAGCEIGLLANFRTFGVVIFLLKFFLKVLQNRLFFVLASRSGFGAAISEAVARSSIVFCNTVSANRIGMVPRLHA